MAFLKILVQGFHHSELEISTRVLLRKLEHRDYRARVEHYRYLPPGMLRDISGQWILRFSRVPLEQGVSAAPETAFWDGRVLLLHPLLRKHCFAPVCVRQCVLVRAVLSGPSSTSGYGDGYAREVVFDHFFAEPFKIFCCLVYPLNRTFDTVSGWL